MWHQLINGLEETFFMIFTSSLIAVLLGLPLSVTLLQSNHYQTKRVRIFQKGLEACLHFICTTPYIVIMLVLIPLTQWLLGTHESSFIAILPLTIVAIPLFTKTCSTAFQQMPKGLIDTYISLGANQRQLIFKVLIPERLPYLIYGFSQMLIQLLGFSVILGVLGGGGIGKLLLEKAYQQYEAPFVLMLILTLISLVLFIQLVGYFLAFGSFKKQEFYPYK